MRKCRRWIREPRETSAKEPSVRVRVDELLRGTQVPMSIVHEWWWLTPSPRAARPDQRRGGRVNVPEQHRVGRHADVTLPGRHQIRRVADVVLIELQ